MQPDNVESVVLLASSSLPGSALFLALKVRRSALSRRVWCILPIASAALCVALGAVEPMLLVGLGNDPLFGYLIDFWRVTYAGLALVLLHRAITTQREPSDHLPGAPRTTKGVPQLVVIAAGLVLAGALTAANYR